MINENNEVQETSQEEEEHEEETVVEDESTETEVDETEEEADDSDETVNELKKKVETLEKQKNHWRKKATTGSKVESKVATQSDDISSTDLYTLVRADVHQDDVSEVVKAAKLLDVTVSEALEDSAVQAILEKRTAHRKAAQATNTKTARKSSHKPSDAEVVEEAKKGNIPDKGSSEAEQLFWARRGGRPENRR